MKIIVVKTDWFMEWQAFYANEKSKRRMVAFGRSPQQAIKRLKNKVCHRWFQRFEDGDKYGIHPTGYNWEWNQIFKTTQGDLNWSFWEGKCWKPQNQK